MKIEEKASDGLEIWGGSARLNLHEGSLSGSVKEWVEGKWKTIRGVNGRKCEWWRHRWRRDKRRLKKSR